MFRIKQGAQLSTEAILAYISSFTSTSAHYAKLHRYYAGSHDILSRTMTNGKPNNKIVNPYPKYITTLYTGYMLGSPIAYNATDEAQEHLESIKAIFSYNDEQSHNSDIGRDMSIYGVAVEMLYIDENGEIRFTHLDPQEVIPVYSDTVTADLAYVIRFYDSQDDILSDVTTRHIQLFTPLEIINYIQTDSGLIEQNKTKHFFNDVPIAFYNNNDEAQGDWESCIPLIDAADKLASDSVNETEYMADAYLAAYGFGGIQQSEADIEAGLTEVETVAKQMKNGRFLPLPLTGAKVEWVVKNLNDTYIENIKKRTDEAIHKFSMCPAMTDENFAANASGVAMKYKLLGFENATATKERNFKKGLQRRIELITNVLNIQNTFNYRDIEITFNRNLPTNSMEAAQLVRSLQGIISEETALAQLPFIPDVQAEMAKIQDEQVAQVFDTPIEGAVSA